jgi:hypothetical protein
VGKHGYPLRPPGRHNGAAFADETILRTVTIGALIKRIKRRLNRERRDLKITRGETARRELGNYYVLDLDRDVVIATQVDPERMGRELRVLDPDEKVE